MKMGELIDRSEGLAVRQAPHQLCFRNALDGHLHATLGLTDQGGGVRIKANGHTQFHNCSPGSIDSDLHQSNCGCERCGTTCLERDRWTLFPKKVTSLPLQDGRIAPNEWSQERLLTAFGRPERGWTSGG